MTRALVGITLLSFSLALLAAACGSGSGSPARSCGKVQPCGGDVVGDWRIVDSCQFGLRFDLPFCPEATVDPAGLMTTGTFSNNADLTNSVATSSGGSFDIHLPAACATRAGMSCANLTASVRSAVEPRLGPGLQSLTCAGTSACVCTVVPVPSTLDETGTYTTSDNVVTTARADGSSSETWGYCVQGGSLHLLMIDPAASLGPMGQLTILFDIVAQKQ